VQHISMWFVKFTMTSSWYWKIKLVKNDEFAKWRVHFFHDPLLQLAGIKCGVLDARLRKSARLKCGDFSVGQKCRVTC